MDLETLDADQFVALFEGRNEDGPSGEPQSTPPVAAGEKSSDASTTERGKSTLDMPPAPAPA
jgi:hypothetical protein